MEIGVRTYDGLPRPVRVIGGEVIGHPLRDQHEQQAGREYVAREHSPVRFRELLADAFRS